MRSDKFIILVLTLCFSLSVMIVSASFAEKIISENYLNSEQMQIYIKKTQKNKFNWLLTGQLKSSYDSGIYHLRFKNIELSHNGRNLFTGLEIGLKISYAYAEEKLLYDDEEISLIGGISRERRNNNALFLMSIGKSW